MMDSSPVCLICHDPLQKRAEVGGLPFLYHQALLFTLKCVVELSDELLLSKFRGQNGAGVGLCGSCEKGVEQAQRLYEQLLETGRKFRETQKKILDKIRNCDHPKRKRQSDETVEIVEFVRNRDYEDFKAPLLVKDWRSSESMTRIAFKEEMEEIVDSFLDVDAESNMSMLLPEDEAEVKSESEEPSENEVSEAELEGDDSSESQDEEWSGAEDMETDPPIPKNPSTPTTTKKGKVKPKKVRMKGKKPYQKKFMFSLEDEDDTGKEKRMFGRVQCPFCPLQGGNNGRIIGMHVRNAHLPEYDKYTVMKKRGKCKAREFTCCGKIFYLWISLYEHLAEKHDAKPLYICELCPEEFSKAFSLRCHAFKAHNHKEEWTTVKGLPRGISCTACGITVKNKRALATHLNKHHKEPVEVDESLRCKTCGKAWKSETGLHVHMAAMHGVRFKKKLPKKKDLPCPGPDCDKIFRNQENLNAHFAKFHEKKFLFNCELCGEGFYKPQRLKDHHQSKHSNTCIICELCGKSFPSSGRLYCHRVQCHREDKKKTSNTNKIANSGVCEICGKSCVHLFQHKVMVHGINAKHVCQVCGQPYLSQAQLDVHLHSRHKIGDRPPEMDKTLERQRQSFQCKVVGCRQRYSKKESMEKHEREMHGETGTEPSFRCQFCGKGFSRKWRWVGHEMTHTNQETKPFHCDICGKGFVNKQYKRYHELNTHKAERKFQRKNKEERDEEQSQL